MSDAPSSANDENKTPKKPEAKASKLPRRIAIGLGAAFVLIQLVPYGRSHENPPVQSEPAWDSPQTKAVFDRACADCHSHRTQWPWYSHVAPVSWLVQRDVNVGRENFNISAAPGQRGEADEAAKEVRKGEMPMAIYTLIHGDAKLGPSERETFAAGLSNTFGGEGESEGGGRGREGGDHDDD